VLTPLDDRQSCAIALVNIEGIDTPKLQQWLWGKHKIMTVAIMHPEFHGLRVTPSVYTTLDEVDLFAEQMIKASRSGIAV
jgi:selenocysteine lyase/cysteine desulfurase